MQKVPWWANVNYTLVTHYNLKVPLVTFSQHNVLLYVSNMLAVLCTTVVSTFHRPWFTILELLSLLSPVNLSFYYHCFQL